MRTAEEAFLVTMPGHKIVIEKERVLLDGEERAKVPATAMRFTLVRMNDSLSVTADGAAVLTTTLGK